MIRINGCKLSEDARCNKVLYLGRAGCQGYCQGLPDYFHCLWWMKVHSRTADVPRPALSQVRDSVNRYLQSFRKLKEDVSWLIVVFSLAISLSQSLINFPVTCRINLSSWLRATLFLLWFKIRAKCLDRLNSGHIQRVECQTRWFTTGTVALTSP